MWRSVRYDLDRRAETRDEDWSPERERLSTLLRDPRRVGAAVGVASIIAASATGTYFAPLVAAPHPASSKAPKHPHHKTTHRTRTTPAQPVPAPEIVAVDDPKPVPTGAPMATSTPVHSPVPESTATVTPRQSPTPSPSPSVS